MIASTKRFCALLIAVTWLTIPVLCHAQAQTTISLNQPVSIFGDVLPGATSVDLHFNVSGATALRLDVIVPVDQPQLALRDPQGKIVFAPGDPDVEFVSGSTLAPGQSLPGGVFTLPTVADPPAGTWTLRAEFPAAPDRTVVLATVFLTTPWQIGIAIERESFVVGEDVSIGLMVLNDGAPVAGPFVAAPTVSVTREGASDPPVVLVGLDNGLGPDGLQDDGIYSVDYTFATVGTYRITGTVALATPLGTVQRTTTRIVHVRVPGLVVGGVTSSPRLGAGGCLSGLAVTVAAAVARADEYIFSATFEAPNGRRTTGSIRQQLPSGPASVDVMIPVEKLRSDLGIGGAYTLAEVKVFEVVEGATVLAFSASSVLQTAALNLDNACVAAVELLASLTATPVLSNRFISTVQLSFPVRVSLAGAYTLSFKVIAADGRDIDLVGGSQTLAAGLNTVSFSVPAAKLLRADGPYSVISLLVIGPAGSASIASLGATPPWQRWQFLPRISGDLDADGDVDINDRSLLLNFRNATPLVPGDRRDLNGDGRLDLIDARLLTGLTCAAGTCPLR